MLQRARQAYPSTQIYAMGTVRNWCVSETGNAVATRNAAGDRKVHFADTAAWSGSADTTDGTHPHMAGHAKVARRLVPIVDQYI